MVEVYVCQDWYPNKKHPKRSGFRMELAIKEYVDVLAKNIVHDFDFTIVIAGKGDVRVGKSVMALQIAAYWAWVMHQKFKKGEIKNDIIFSLERNLVFTGIDLIKAGHYLGQHAPFSPLIYDEAGADLQGIKVMRSTTQFVLDYFRECGQYNLLNIIVTPDYFDLPKGIAMNRSDCLINVFYTIDKENLFKRGYYYFYSKEDKKKLYLWGKKELDYGARKGTLWGRFYDFYTLDEEKYRKLKLNALVKRDTRLKENWLLVMRQRNFAWFLLNKIYNLSTQNLTDAYYKYCDMRMDRTNISTSTVKVADELNDRNMEVDMNDFPRKQQDGGGVRVRIKGNLPVKQKRKKETTEEERIPSKYNIRGKNKK